MWRRLAIPQSTDGRELSSILERRRPMLQVKALFKFGGSLLPGLLVAVAFGTSVHVPLPIAGTMVATDGQARNADAVQGAALTTAPQTKTTPAGGKAAPVE